jgi:Peptidase family M1 domain
MQGLCSVGYRPGTRSASTGRDWPDGGSAEENGLPALARSVAVRRSALTRLLIGTAKTTTGSLTRSSKFFFTDPIRGDDVVVHENAHQWYGDSVSVAEWKHIWLNEGFATYAEWLWSEHEGLGTTQEVFDFFYNLFPEGDPF